MTTRGSLGWIPIYVLGGSNKEHKLVTHFAIQSLYMMHFLNQQVKKICVVLGNL